MAAALRFVVVVSLAFTVAICTASDMFSSVAQLEEMYHKEQEISVKLRMFLDNVKKQVGVVDKYLQELEDLRRNGETMSRVLGNPINAFHLLRRLTIVWTEMKAAFVTQSNTSRIIDEVMSSSLHFPTDEDFSGAAFSLAQLQAAYRLNVSQLARGNFQMSDNVYSSARGLDARDCLFIGKHAFNKGLYDQAVQWLQTALELSKLEADGPTKPREVLPFLNTAIRVHDDILEKKGPFGKDWKTLAEPINPRRLERFRKRQNQPGNNGAVNTDALGLATMATPAHEELEVFFKLCRGEKLRSASVEKKLKCRYARQDHAYFRLRRLKLEEMSHAPFIVVLHEFMNDGEMEMFKSLASVRLARSEHGGRHGPTQSDKRTSKQAWIQDDEDARVARISARISSAVRMTAEPYNVGAEYYQVANYGIGGRYTPHLDHGILDMAKGNEANPEDSFRGERIATLMTYLEDVEAGGATVFPFVGVTIWPKKGSAAFWWNLFSDQSGDVQTRHGGCPVLYGSKWICNKWYHNNEQMLLQPCDTKPKSRYAYP